ncbi:MAG: GGDEF domain-containing protein [Phormidesmis priestleyi]|uniref:GGDEF domain-containing protein n=1 Tax=Phormidesmis priestleyi TaxID=268141 RepID=A0A2W4WW87_9CYAN|nr:MAG: GGDEF domain-containing protein [Phormidesmis priestleyi]
MPLASRPAKETLRLAKLQSYEILDTPPEPAYDDITSLAAHICQTPTALISLIDANRQWFKSKVGFEANESARNIAFCDRTIQQSNVLIVEDTHQSAQFRDNPLVTGAPHIRFYAGTPLITPDGHALGSLCVIDYVPHQLTAKQLQALRALSRQVITQMELARHAQQLKAINAQLEQKVRARTLKLSSALQQLSKTQTKLLKREAALRQSALHDPLTGLPNRSYFLQRLDQAIQLVYRQPQHLYAVLFIDLDNFKPVNDTLGHEIGDFLLQHIAKQIKSLLRKSDLLARVGGDEFAVLLDDIPDQDHAIFVVQRLQARLKQPFVMTERRAFIGASIGITFSCVGYRHPEAALRDANAAMRYAKKQSKQQSKALLQSQLKPQRSEAATSSSKVASGQLSGQLSGQPPIVIQDEALLHQQFAVFDTVLQGQAAAQITLEDELRQALLRHEFHLYYQPIFDLSVQPFATPALTGFEVLIRWHHPTRGCLEAEDFIAIAEELGIVRQLCSQVIQTACQQLKAWRAHPAYADLCLHINLSLLQLTSPQIVSQWRTYLAKYDLPAAAFQLEIEEQVLLSDDATITQVLNQLKALGLRLCVDDFGCGHSSLSRLHQLEISTLKIDRSLIKELTRTDVSDPLNPQLESSAQASTKGTDIIKTILDLGNSAGMSVIAEGIETSEQLAALVALGCRLGQGFWLSEALSVAAIDRYLAK